MITWVGDFYRIKWPQISWNSQNKREVIFVSMSMSCVFGVSEYKAYPTILLLHFYIFNCISYYSYSLTNFFEKNKVIYFSKLIHFNSIQLWYTIQGHRVCGAAWQPKCEGVFLLVTQTIHEKGPVGHSASCCRILFTGSLVNSVAHCQVGSTRISCSMDILYRFELQEALMAMSHRDWSSRNHFFVEECLCVLLTISSVLHTSLVVGDCDPFIKDSKLLPGLIQVKYVMLEWVEFLFL